MPMNVKQIQEAINDPNVRKMLDLLAHTEGTEKNGYYTAFGGGRLESLADHPRTTKAFQETTGKANKSSAAGRYQFLAKTWDSLRSKFPDQMPDFGEKSQDFGAVALIVGAGALKDVQAGRFGTAISKLGGMWASLPSSKYNQPKKSWEDVNKFLGVSPEEFKRRKVEAETLQSIKAYKEKRMSPEGRAQFEDDVRNKRLPVPKGFTLDAPKQPNAMQAATKVQNIEPERMTLETMYAYLDKKMSPEGQAKFEDDYRNHRITAPEGVTSFSLRPPEEQGGLLSQTGDILGRTGRTIAGDGVIDAATAIPRTVAGGAQAIIQGVAGMGVSAVAGLGGTGAAIGKALQGGSLDESLQAGTDVINRVQAAAQPYMPQPVVAPETTAAIGETLAIPSLATKAAGEANFDAYGNPLAATTTETAANLLGLLAPTKSGVNLARRAVGKPPIAPQPTPATSRPTPEQPTPQAEQPRAQPAPEPMAEPAPTAQAAEPAPQSTAQPKPEGKKQGRAYTADNKPVDFEYDVIPSSELVTSHDKSLKINPNFPPELQPRDRSRAASDAQINAIQNNLNPERLAESASVSEGAPIIGADRVVESGNGRTIAIGRAYDTGQAAGYKQFLTDNAARFGLDPQQIASMPDPVLVRRRTSEVDREQFTKAANVSNVAQMSAAERAASDAAILPDASTLKIADDGVVDIAGSTDFVRSFVRGLPKTEQAEMMARDGTLSQAGKRRIESALSQKAYDDPVLLERVAEQLGADGKRISDALTKQAGALVALADDVKAGAKYDNTLAADLAQAANKYADIKAKGDTVQEYIAQGQLVDDGLSIGAREALQVFGDNARSSKAISEYIQGKIEEINAKGNPSQESLFQGKKAKDEIAKLIADQVEATGKTKEYAKAAGELVGAYYAATAKALGRSAKEVFDQVGLSVKNGEISDANAALKLGEREHQMVFGKDANASSFIHEAGHHFLETHAKLADQSPQMKADLDAVMEWGGHKGRDWSQLTANQKRELHEKFAESFERYLLTGKAPTSKLKAVFERFKAWMSDVYQSLADFAEVNPRAELSPEIMSVMDRMLGGKGSFETKGTPTKKVDVDLLDFKRSAPVTGGVSPSQHQARYNVLRNIGLTDEQIRGGVVTGDKKRMEWDAELAKYDTEYGMKMKEQLELETQKLREYGDKVTESMGGTPNADPATRGASIVKPLHDYATWYKKRIGEFYEAAGKAAESTGGIELNGLQAKLREHSFFASNEMKAIRKGIASWIKEQGLMGKDGAWKPMSAKNAEQLRQWLNAEWRYEISGKLGQLKALIDDDVFQNLGTDLYKQARAESAKYHRIFDDPKGMAQILGTDGVNRTISLEKIGDKLAAFAATDMAQFRMIVDQLQAMPTPKMQAAADKALGEVRTLIAERITRTDPTATDTQAAVARAFAPYRGEKLNEILGKDNADNVRNYVAAVGILRKVDAQPSGTASAMRNIMTKGAEVGSAGLGTLAGTSMGGAAGAAAGAILGQQIGAKIKGAIAESVDKKSYGKAMSPRQMELMRQTYNAAGRKVEQTAEAKALGQAIDEGAAEGKVKILANRLSKTKEWANLYGKLTPEQQALIKKIGIAAWFMSYDPQNSEGVK